MADRDAVTVERGPLVFALPIGAEWTKVKDREGLPFDDYEVHPTTPWNYALLVGPGPGLDDVTFEYRRMGEHPFTVEGAPVAAKVKGRRLPGWGMEQGAAAPPPQSPVESSEPLEDLTLVPYGCTTLRITEFPVLKPEPPQESP